MNKSSILFTMGLVGIVVMFITSGQRIPEQQFYTKGSSLHEIHSAPVFETEPKPFTKPLQKQVSTEEGPKVKINSNNTLTKKIVKNPELQNSDKENITITTQPKKAATKSPEQSNLKSATPDMGNTRIDNGIKQVYFLGFGWIDDDNKPNEEIAAKDMFENGNKVGNMEGSTVMDSDGDINKMVGTMGD